MYDAALTQLVRFHEVECLGGLKGTLPKLLEADPNFVMGHVMSVGMDVMGTIRSSRLDREFQKSIDQLVAMAETAKINDRERRHVEAVKVCADGHMDKASAIWDDILIDHPLDVLALIRALSMGYKLQNWRDLVARVLPYWTPDMPHYGFLMSMYSFGLCETNMFKQAEKVAREWLEISPGDGLTTHSMGHIFEMQGRVDEGITFFSSTVQDWERCGLIACHNSWHWALFYIEKGEYQSALDIYDSRVIKSATQSGAMLDLSDSCAMLWRLEMEGVDIGDRWNDIFEVCRPHIDDHILAFNDIYVLMSCLGARQTDTVEKLMVSIKAFIEHGEGINRDVTRDVGIIICEAFAAYRYGEFAKAVELLYPIRYEVNRVGGSRAQRDIFPLFLINAALKSTSAKHHRVARQLVAERKAQKEKSPMTDRMMTKAMTLNVD